MRPCGTCSSHPESATTTGQGGLQGWGSPSWGVGQSPCVIARSAHSRAWLPVQSPLNPQHRVGTGGPQCPPHSHRGPSAPASQHSARVWPWPCLGHRWCPGQDPVLGIVSLCTLPGSASKWISSCSTQPVGGCVFVTAGLEYGELVH